MTPSPDGGDPRAVGLTRELPRRWRVTREPQARVQTPLLRLRTCRGAVRAWSASWSVDALGLIAVVAAVTNGDGGLDALEVARDLQHGAEAAGAHPGALPHGYPLAVAAGAVDDRH